MAISCQNILFGTNDGDLKYQMSDYSVTQKSLEESIEKLIDWIQLQPHFPNTIDAKVLTRVLLTNGYSTEKSKKKLENLLLARTDIPEFFKERNIFDINIKQVFDSVDLAIMPQLSDRRHRISIMCIRDVDAEIFNAVNCYKVLFMMCDLKLFWETSQGDHIIWDCRSTKLGHVVKITPLIIKKAFFLIENCYGARIKGIHLINAPSFTNSVINALKMVLKAKIVNRIYIHKTVEELHEHIRPEYLPKELGGFQKTYSEISGLWYDCMKTEETQNILKYFDGLTINKNRMPPNSKVMLDDVLGVSGTFRKLELD